MRVSSYLIPMAVALGGVMFAAVSPKPAARGMVKPVPKTASKTAGKAASPKAAPKAGQKTAAKNPAATYRGTSPQAKNQARAAYRGTPQRRTVRTASGGRRVQAPVRSWQMTQQQPSTERYKEIQEALAARGYTVGADGTWGSDSAEALKKFQQSQNLDASGKVNSLSLIALGLGPKRGPGPVSGLSGVSAPSAAGGAFSGSAPQ